MVKITIISVEKIARKVYFNQECVMSDLQELIEFYILLFFLYEL